MSLKSKRFKAFTIIELLVALTISSVVVTLSLYVYFQFQKMVVTNTRIAKQVDNTVLFLTQFRNDFEEAETIKKRDSNMLSISLYKGDITYVFEDSAIRKIRNRAEMVFGVGFENYSVFVSEKHNLVERLSFDIIYPDKRRINVLLTKKYMPDILINNNYKASGN